MLPFNLRTWTRGQILLAMMSILTVLDVAELTTTESTKTSTAVIIDTAASSQSQSGNHPTSVPAQTPGSSNQPSAAAPAQTGPTVHSLTVSGPTSTTLIKTNESNNRNSTEMQVSQETFTTLTSNVTDIRNLVSQGSENTTVTKTEPTTQTVQSPNSTTVQQSTSLKMDVLLLQTTAAPGIITCLGLGSYTSNIQVVCFQYEEETTCETFGKKKKEELMYFLCEIMNTTQCNVTIYHSEVQPKCILWVPSSKDAKNRLTLNTTKSKLPTETKWGQVSDHQTRSQKTMIALVTCGVLLAAFILAGYFLSNRESWSPGRQRLGEDPYCTETDSQGNTLVSVSAHAQDKPTSGSRENGTGQTVSPAATNGHSTKKQTVSDTEL
ncbi:hematopoietic progenitor cell antigen CD34 [Rhinoderma darwinii]|uniref:hematopoietic progenitor cell antigen CD34 n=1 Tax=Rhinoderma darwinii TaxID=43563 RepID=UPI003F675300